MRIGALGKLFRQHHRQLYIAAMSITKNRAAAEDAVHDALVSVAEISTEPDDLKSYLFRTVRNKAMHSVKHANRYSNEVSDFIASDDNSFEQQLFAKRVLEEMVKLTSDQQQTIVMKLFGNLTFSEIAAITETPQNTVASWYRRGIQILKESFNEKR